MIRSMRFVPGCALAVSLLIVPEIADAQLSYTSGQTISPAYEGFEVNPGGSYNLLFGYLNRNWEEVLNIPVGAENYFSPGLPDRGQPTHFLPRRNRFVFKVHLPADFDPTQEVVWTLMSQGVEKKAYATLRPDLLVDNMIIASETGALGGGRSDPDNRLNTAPVIELGTDREIAALVGQPVTLIAQVTDDGLPITLEERRARADPVARGEVVEATSDTDVSAEDEDAIDAAGAANVIDGVSDETESEQEDADTADDAPDETEEEKMERERAEAELLALRGWLNRPIRLSVDKVIGLHFTWFVYRGDTDPTFDPIQIKPWEDTRAFHNSPWSPSWEAPSTPEDNRWVTQVTFDKPGTYVLRGRADDGSLFADAEVTINVRPLLP